MRIKRSASVLVLTAASLVAMAASALAYTGSTGTFSLTKEGVAFQSASYKFLNYETYDFYYTGYLKDTSSDGNSVFVHGKLEGYGYGSKLYVTSGNGTGATKSQYLYSNSITVAQNARVEACQDRGTFYSDLCASQYFVNYVR